MRSLRQTTILHRTGTTASPSISRRRLVRRPGPSSCPALFRWQPRRFNLSPPNVRRHIRCRCIGFERQLSKTWSLSADYVHCEFSTTGSGPTPCFYNLRPDTSPTRASGRPMPLSPYSELHHPAAAGSLTRRFQMSVAAPLRSELHYFAGLYAGPAEGLYYEPFYYPNNQMDLTENGPPRR